MLDWPVSPSTTPHSSIFKLLHLGTIPQSKEITAISQKEDLLSWFLVPGGHLALFARCLRTPTTTQWLLCLQMSAQIWGDPDPTDTKWSRDQLPDFVSNSKFWLNAEEVFSADLWRILSTLPAQVCKPQEEGLGYFDRVAVCVQEIPNWVSHQV